jgi:hypothetical protein
VVRSKVFNRCVTGIIIMNTMSLAVTWLDMPEYLRELKRGGNNTLLSLFVVELILKLIAYKSVYF